MVLIIVRFKNHISRRHFSARKCFAAHWTNIAPGHTYGDFAFITVSFHTLIISKIGCGLAEEYNCCMEVQEFVTNVLKQLESGLGNASKESHKKDFYFDGSVKFDLAVTHTTSKEGDVGGKVKGGIKVVDFELGGKGTMAAGHEVVQRIQFSVFVEDKSREVRTTYDGPDFDI